MGTCCINTKRHIIRVPLVVGEFEFTQVSLFVNDIIYNLYWYVFLFTTYNWTLVGYINHSKLFPTFNLGYDKKYKSNCDILYLKKKAFVTALLILVVTVCFVHISSFLSSPDNDIVRVSLIIMAPVLLIKVFIYIEYLSYVLNLSLLYYSAYGLELYCGYLICSVLWILLSIDVVPLWVYIDIIKEYAHRWLEQDGNHFITRAAGPGVDESSQLTWVRFKHHVTDDEKKCPLVSER